MKPGAKLKSAVCDTEVMVIRGAEIQVECGGVSMSDQSAAQRGTIDPAFAQGTKIGKRYVDAAGKIELLCDKNPLIRGLASHDDGAGEYPCRNLMPGGGW